jgi:hypothetical protein
MVAIGPVSINNSGGPSFSTSIPTIIPKDPYAPQEAQKTGKELKLAPLGVAEQLVADQIEKEFNIKMKNTRDSRFKERELKIILAQLRRLPVNHVELVDEIVKNTSLGLELELMEAKQNKRKEVLGAYDKDNRRIYLFNDLSDNQLVRTLTHEVGHAVHSHQMHIGEFFKFMAAAKWDLVKQEQTFIPGNALYNIGYKESKVDKKNWKNLEAHFDWDAIKKKRANAGGFSFKAPKAGEHMYAYSNPFETFACFYEKTYT